ncbi:MAG: hypothetical protein HXY40_07865 [Chloroflexi bacterium]|nr:hypothetical protein [Chloroflexota bacterium]
MMHSQSACHYQLLETGIHQFVFTLPSRQAVDVWIQHLMTIYEQQQATLFLLDIRESGILPMTYVFQRLSQWVATHPRRPLTYVALLHKDVAPIALVQPFIHMLGIDGTYKMRFFGEQMRAQAVHWLLNQAVSVA